jgi:chaperone modulatory protein CbpM
MHEDNILIGSLMEDACLTLEQLAVACTVEPEWLIHRIEDGLFPPMSGPVAEWRFSTVNLRRARRMRELERDFDAVPELAALVADLLENMDELRARLRRTEPA